VDELDAVDRLVADRARILLQLREAPQPHQHTTAGNARVTEADPVDHQRETTDDNGAGVAISSAVFSVSEAGSLCSIGTLLAFIIVSAGILALRVRGANPPRRFTTPWVWFVVSRQIRVTNLSGRN